MCKVILKDVGGYSDETFYLKLTDCQKKFLDYLIEAGVIDTGCWSAICLDENLWEEV